MTYFQLLALGLFFAVVAFTYGQELLAAAKSLASFKPILTPEEDAVAPSVAVLLVNDIINITELRDKLAAQGCKEGVEACTTLLRVIVEFEQSPDVTTAA